MWLPLWEKVVVHLFPFHSFQFFVLSEQLFGRICHFLKIARFIDRLKCGGSFASYRLSIICCASGPNALSARSLSSSGKSESDFLWGSKVFLCHLIFAVACDCGLTYFRRNLMSTSSCIRLLLAYMFLNNCGASCCG